MKGLTIGKFDRKITFLKRVEQPNEYNAGPQVWQSLDGTSTWCNVVPYRQGGESVRADQLSEHRTTLFYVRWRTDIDTTMRISWGNDVYNIGSISEPSAYRKQLIEIAGEIIPEERWP